MKMNLTIDPWIPVLRNDGKREFCGLHELFARAHEFRDLVVKPHERIATMRLLVCITQAALDGPADEDEWEECLPFIQSRVSGYLKQWESSFEFLGEGDRILQFSNLKQANESTKGTVSTKLDLTLAAGNTPILFDNMAGGERSTPVARSAINLLSFQCFSPGGRIGIAKWNSSETAGKGSSNHAPCTPSSMVHTLLIGGDLLQTLRLNLLTKETVSDNYGATGWGKPIWEHSVKSADDKAAIHNATMTYLGRMVPLSRAVRFNEDGLSVILANGLDYPIFPAFREATATIITRKDELAILPANPSRGLWRQLAAISVRRRASANQNGGPLSLNHEPGAQDAVVWVGALATDKAKIIDTIESTYSIPTGMFSEFGRAAYEKGVAYAESFESALIQSVKTYSGALKIANPAYNSARQHFWGRVEQHLSSLFDIARSPDIVANLPGSAWGKDVQAAMYAAYEQSCPRQSARQLMAYSLGIHKLTIRPKTKG